MMEEQLARTQKDMYEHIWGCPEYRQICHGLNLWREHREIFPETFDSALDLGCGLGLLVKELNESGIDCWGVDIAENSLDAEVWAYYGLKCYVANLWEIDLRKRFDVGICADVMEHIPETRVPQVLERIASHCDLVIFKISAIRSEFLGYDLHPTKRAATWWAAQILRAGGQLEQLQLPTDRKEYFFKWLT